MGKIDFLVQKRKGKRMGKKKTERQSVILLNDKLFIGVANSRGPNHTAKLFNSFIGLNYNKSKWQQFSDSITFKSLKYQSPGLWFFPKINNLRFVLSVYKDFKFKHKPIYLRFR